MRSELLISIVFSLPAALIIIGVYFQSKAVVDQARGQVQFGKFWPILLKYFGFAILAYLVYECKGNKLYLGLLIFIATYAVSFLLYLLARRLSLR
jgi:hypothetical protein